jgi:hypothetical protein
MFQKNKKHVCTRILVMAAVVALALTALWVSEVGAKPKVPPPHSKAYGKTVAEWLTIYWRWMFEGGEGKVGNVQLMPMPAGDITGGTGTVDDPLVITGELDITIEAGTPFVLPLFAWIGERYEDGSEDPPIPDEDLIALIHPNLTIDGETIVSDDNKEAFYVGPTWFEPAIMYPEPPEPPEPSDSVAAIWHQGFGIVSLPLSEGEHVIHLWEPFTLPGYPYLAYNNTWNVTVVEEDDDD